MRKRRAIIILFVSCFLFLFSSCYSTISLLDEIVNSEDYETEEYKVIDKDTGKEKTYVIKKKKEKKDE